MCGCSVISVNDEGIKKNIVVKQQDRDIRTSLLRRNQIAQSSVVLRKEILQSS
jgi:hypothetical protein